MSYNGSGTFNINTAGQPVVTGTTITSTAFNLLTADLASGLTTALTKDGQTTPTANIPMGSFKITGLGAGSAATDAAQYGQLQAGATTIATVTGTDTLTGSVTPALGAYATGNLFSFVAANTNTGAATININSLGAKSITKQGATALVAGDITSGRVYLIEYDGTRFQLVNSASPAGSNTQVQYNNAGVFAGSANMTFDGTTLTAAGLSGPHNGTVGATTPASGAFTSVTSSGVTNSFGPATNASVANLFSGTKTGYSMVSVDSCTLSPPATSDAAIIFIQPAVGNTIQKASSATHTNFSALHVAPPAIGAGSAALTNASAIYVPSAPSGATNNYAISIGSGTSSFNGLVDISGASGGQIKFPATQNASSNANTLDDYEEGTWTPNIGGTATYYSQTGRYVKIGQIVYLYMYLRPLLIGTGNANGEIYGVPFAANRSSVAVGPVLSIGYYQALGASVTSLVSGMVDATTILLLGQTAAATTNGGINGIMANATQIEMSGTYQATA
jgi:hypothetical protein